MASKNQLDDRPGSAERDKNNFQASSKSTSTGMSPPAAFIDGKKPRKVPDATHGLKFESKLLTLFCVRALKAGYTFELTKEREDLGGKFDDVIFRYQVPDDTPTGKHWRYRYLQAKHKLNEMEMVKANDLLKDKDESFSLPKYFRSFCKMRTRDEDIQDCILCTNIGFDSIDLKQKGIQLVSINDQPEDILDFGLGQNTARYKLRFTQDIRRTTLNEWSDIYRIAKQLQICARNQTTADMRTGVFSSYHIALVRERVIDSFTKGFHADFVREAMDLPNGAKHLRQAINELVNDDDWKTWKFKLSHNFGKRQFGADTEHSLPLKNTDKEMDDFFDKLVFVVNMPNEKKFENILQSEDVSKYYSKSECSDQTLRILHEMPNEFADKDVGYWLTSQEGKKILLAGVTRVSLQYQKQLENEVGFHVDASREMSVRLRDLLSSKNTVERIATQTPRSTSVKVISAIQILNREHGANVSFLLISSVHLQDAEDAQRWKNIFQLPNKFGCYFVLLICDESELSLPDDDYAKLFPSEEENTQRSKVIVISPNAAAITSDSINYTQLSDLFKQKILSKIVSFQGTNASVGHLVGSKPEDVLGSLEELLRPEREQIVIPSFDASRFEKSLYIKRQVKFAFDAENLNAELAKRLNCTADELLRQCRISSQGRVKWLVDGERRKDIWKQMKTFNDPTSKKIEDTNHFFCLGDEKKEQPVVIICGVAGTGKSTLLSHYYCEIKKAKPDYWVIKVNLVEHCEAISKLNKKRPELMEFLINDLHVIDSKSPFSCSLFKHRLETGDRIVCMISNQCQETVIQLMKSIEKKKSIQLYVTTRPHMADNLQYELCQLAYSLDNFSEDDQTHYLASFWMKELKLPEDNSGVIMAFAKLLVPRVSETLKDKEQSFIGIPLQCRILAECYRPHIDEIMRDNIGNYVKAQSEDVLLSQRLLALLENQKSDLISLYSRLMDTKRKLFREEKANSVISYQIMTDAMDSWTKKIESRLTKLAFETIVREQNILQFFWPPKSSHKSVEDVIQQENTLAVNILMYGLTFSTGDAMRPQQFLHRTFAEYFVAKYLYEGFHLDEKRHNKLLENKSIRKLILNKILATEQYDGVQLFFDSMVKNLVDEDEEWRNTIDRRKLPDRLKKFTENLFTQFLRQKMDLFVIGKRFYVANRFSANALYFSLLKARSNIFKLLCDCLESTFEKRQIRWAILMTFQCHFNFFPYTFFRESKLFKQCIDYVDIDADDQFTWKFVWRLINQIVIRYDVRPSCLLTNCLWYRGEPQRTMTHLLDCLGNQRVAFDEHFCSFSEFDEFRVRKMLGFLYCYENYRPHLEIFLNFLSRSKFYSDDGNFARLLMGVSESEKHGTSGKIAKTLDILHALGRRPLLVHVYGKVLTMDPEAFQKIYEPCRLEKEDALLANIHSLLERDPFGMTHLHGAAFYGDIEVVDHILATICQRQLRFNRVIDQVWHVMFEGYTPFFLAAARGHGNICCSILAFLKGMFSGLNWNSTCYLDLSLAHAMQSDNLEMLRLVLKVVKKELGHGYLLHFLKKICVMESCSSKEMFEAIAKIIVDRDGIIDYKCLSELIFNEDETLREALQFISGQHCKVTLMSHVDAESLQALLSLEGANIFAKRILCTKYGPSHGFRVLSKFLLRNLSKDQLFDCVEMITRLGDTKIVERDWPKAFPTYYLGGTSYGKRSVEPVPNLRSNSELIYTPNGDVTSTVRSGRVVPRSSFWKDFLRSSINSLNGSSAISPEDERCIFECMACVSDKLGCDYAKELLLHQDDDGYVVTSLSQEIVKLMLNCLPERSQEEIKQEWKLNTPPMAHDSFIPLHSTNLLSNRAIARYYSDVLRFYLDYGGDAQLKECVNILTSVRLIDGQQRSAWSYIFEHCEKTESNELLKSMWVMFGREAVKKLLLHKIDGFPLILKAVLWRDDINSWWPEMLPQEIRDDMQQVIELNAAEFIEEAFLHHEAYVKKLGHPYLQQLISTLTFFLNYSNDEQLKLFVQCITTLHISSQMGNRLSIWADMLLHQYWNDDDVTKLERFFGCVKEKLGPNAVKELVLRKLDDIPVLCWVALRGEEKLLEAMLTNLDAKSRKTIQRQVNEFLDVAFRVPSDGVVTNAMLKAVESRAFSITL